MTVCVHLPSFPSALFYPPICVAHPCLQALVQPQSKPIASFATTGLETLDGGGVADMTPRMHVYVAIQQKMKAQVATATTSSSDVASFKPTKSIVSPLDIAVQVCELF